MAIATKWFHGEMQGATVLNRAVGSLNAVIQSILIDGFNLKTVDSITSNAGIATLTVTSNHGFEKHQVILVSGSSQSEYNGEFRVLSTTPTTLTYAITGTPVTPATGTITVKAAPIGGWERAFNSSNVSIYKSTSLLSSQMRLRVDDSELNYAWVTGCEDATSVTDIINAFPRAYPSKKLCWGKSKLSDDAAIKWFIAGNDLGFHLFIKWDQVAYAFNSFTDFPSYKSGDAFNCYIQGQETNGSNPSHSGSNSFQLDFSGRALGAYAPRPFFQLGSPVNIGKLSLANPSRGGGFWYYNQRTLSGASTGITFPNKADNSIVLFQPLLVENTNFNIDAPCDGLRGSSLPLIYCVHNSGGLGDFETLENIPQHPNKAFKVLRVADSDTYANLGCIAVDITGD